MKRPRSCGLAIGGGVGKGLSGCAEAVGLDHHVLSGQDGEIAPLRDADGLFGRERAGGNADLLIQEAFFFQKREKAPFQLRIKIVPGQRLWLFRSNLVLCRGLPCGFFVCFVLHCDFLPDFPFFFYRQMRRSMASLAGQGLFLSLAGFCISPRTACSRMSGEAGCGRQTCA